MNANDLKLSLPTKVPPNRQIGSALVPAFFP